MTKKQHTSIIRDLLGSWVQVRARMPLLRVSLPSVRPNLSVLDRRDDILALAPLLEELAARCGQPGAMHWLPYFLDEGVTRFRVPFLVLTLRSGTIAHQQNLQTTDIEAGALFFEYRFMGIRTGIVSTGDAVGFNSIVAPQGERTRVAAEAARALLQRGASVVLATFESAGEPEVKAAVEGSAGPAGVVWGWRERQLGRILPLEGTFDATLGQLGKSTRFNLRYYRRRLVKDVGCEYVPDAVPLLRGADLRTLNANSLNPVPVEEFERRVRSSSELSGSYLCGLRSADGRWLSLIGGWRQDGTTILFWQLNTLGFERYSIGTVMRSFYLEDEIARGATRLLIFGGTSHTMRHGFLEDPVADLVVQRPGLRSAAIRALARFMGSPSNRFGRPNYFADVLRNAELQWFREAQAGSASENGMIESSSSRKIA